MLRFLLRRSGVLALGALAIAGIATMWLMAWLDGPNPLLGLYVPLPLIIVSGLASMLFGAAFLFKLMMSRP